MFVDFCSIYKITLEKMEIKNIWICVVGGFGGYFVWRLDYNI